MSPASPQDFWGPASIETVYSDEQKSPKSEIKYTDSVVESEDEGQIMLINSYDTPPLDFEEDFIKVSRLAESNQQNIIKCYEMEKPLPTIVEDEFDYYYKKINESDEMIDDAVFTKVEFSSQDPANMVIYPTTITEVQSSPGETENITNNNYVEEKSSFNVVMDHQNNQQNNNNNYVNETPRVLKLKLPKIPSNMFEDNVVNTPEIIQEALDLEFDLVSYITDPKVRDLNDFSVNLSSPNFCYKLILISFQFFLSFIDKHNI